METRDRIRTPPSLGLLQHSEGLLRAVPAVTQILTRREAAEPRESGERLCSGERDFAVEGIPDCFFAIDGKRRSRDSNFSEDFSKSPTL